MIRQRLSRVMRDQIQLRAQPREAGDPTWPSEHLFGGRAGRDPALWSAGVAVNVVLSAQWAIYPQITRSEEAASDHAAVYVDINI